MTAIYQSTSLSQLDRVEIDQNQDGSTSVRFTVCVPPGCGVHTWIDGVRIEGLTFYGDGIDRLIPIELS